MFSLKENILRRVITSAPSYFTNFLTLYRKLFLAKPSQQRKQLRVFQLIGCSTTTQSSLVYKKIFHGSPNTTFSFTCSKYISNV